MITSRRNFLKKLIGTSAFCCLPKDVYAFNIFKNTGDIRKIRLMNSNTGENINTIYWIEGNYVQEALDQISYFMRDWRQNKTINYDTNNLDIISATQALLDTDEPFELLSVYRTKKTNKMLSRHTVGVARNSYHTKGMAADLRMKSRSVKQIAKAAESFRSGGVGRYYNSHFVHIDSGRRRVWSQ